MLFGPSEIAVFRSNLTNGKTIIRTPKRGEGPTHHSSNVLYAFLSGKYDRMLHTALQNPSVSDREGKQRFAASGAVCLVD
jgi:hypothetical protein